MEMAMVWCWIVMAWSFLGDFQKNRFELVVQILGGLVVENSASHNIIWLMVMLCSWVWLVFLLRLFQIEKHGFDPVAHHARHRRLVGKLEADLRASVVKLHHA
jgi:hypothetical protein